METLKYNFEQNLTFKKKGVKTTVKEFVKDGETGLTIRYLKKEGDKKFYKVFIKEDKEKKDSFIIKEKVDEGEETEKVINLKELNKILEKLKLEKISHYVANERGTYQGKKVISKVRSKVISKLSSLA